MHLLKNKRLLWNFLNSGVGLQRSKMASGSGTVNLNMYSKIETFVFFDLETTDLIRGSKMPKITELSMVATSRNHLSCDRRNKLALPRILHKLTIPICPMQPINPQASYISNLWNDALENVKPFDEKTYNMIMQFIERLPGKICFVAHNGNRFDYPIFLWEIEQLNKVFPDNILCVDSLDAFKEFFSDIETVPPPPTIPEGIDEVDEEELKRQKSNSSLEDDWNNALYTVLDNMEKTKRELQEREDYKENYMKLRFQNGTDVLDAVTNQDPNSEKTIPSPMQAINEKTPENQIIRDQISTISPQKMLSGVRKKLNFSNVKPKSFKLATVHMHLIGCDPEIEHCAEEDCLSMLRCVCQLGPYFAEWADMNAVSLSLLKK